MKKIIERVKKDFVTSIVTTIVTPFVMPDHDYKLLRDRSLRSMSDYEFSYVIYQLLYLAKPIDEENDP